MRAELILVAILLLCRYGSSKSPNVLFIIIDDLKPALKCYGDENAYTPNIDALGERSFLFENAFAQQALCAPSRNSLLTSRRPDSLRLYDFYSYWRSSVGNFTTLPQHFKDNGYFTYSIGKVFHPGISSNFTDDYPYSWSVEAYRPSTEKYMNEKVCVDRNGRLAKNLICPVIVESQPEGTLPDLQSLREAVSFLKYKDRITDGKPFFLAVGLHKPHVPFKVPSDYFDFHPIENVTLPTNRFRPSELPVVAWNPWTDIRWRDDIRKLNIPFPFGPMQDEVMKRIIQAYNTAITYVDDLIGQLLKHVSNDTIVVLTGDHGWSTGQHGEFSKYSNFDEATRVPLLIHVPGLSDRKVNLNNPVELVDLFPTLVDLTRVSDSLKVCSTDNTKDRVCTEGRSLVPVMVKAVLGESELESSAAFTQYPRPGAYPTSNSDKPRLREIEIMGYSIRTKQFRYTEWIKFNSTSFTADWSKTYGRELYDHQVDPEENMNLADRKELDWILKNLRKKLRLGWRHVKSER